MLPDASIRKRSVPAVEKPRVSLVARKIPVFESLVNLKLGSPASPSIVLILEPKVNPLPAVLVMLPSRMRSVSVPLPESIANVPPDT